jgi:hypothetical protein
MYNVHCTSVHRTVLSDDSDYTSQINSRATKIPDLVYTNVLNTHINYTSRIQSPDLETTAMYSQQLHLSNKFQI